MRWWCTAPHNPLLAHIHSSRGFNICIYAHSTHIYRRHTRLFNVKHRQEHQIRDQWWWPTPTTTIGHHRIIHIFDEIFVVIIYKIYLWWFWVWRPLRANSTQNSQLYIYIQLAVIVLQSQTHSDTNTHAPMRLKRRENSALTDAMNRTKYTQVRRSTVPHRDLAVCCEMYSRVVWCVYCLVCVCFYIVCVHIYYIVYINNMCVTLHEARARRAHSLTRAYINVLRN